MNFIALCEQTTQFSEEPNVRIAVWHDPGLDHGTRSCIRPTRGPYIAMVATTASAREWRAQRR